MSNKKIGLVVMGRIDVGGGYPRVIYDMIKVLNQIGKEVYLLTPFNPDMQKVQEFYGKIEIKKLYCLKGLRKTLGLNDILRRWIMKREFLKMAKDVDFIIDVDGRIMDEYLPKSFDKNKYVIWAVSGITSKPLQNNHLLEFKSFRDILKFSSESLFGFFVKLPNKQTKIYPLDKWTKNMFNGLGLNLKEFLYPPIQTKLFKFLGKKNKKQIVILGRIDPWKNIEDSIRIFDEGTKDNLEYNLVIIGGVAPTSREYILKLEELIDKLGIKARVKIIKNPSFEEIIKQLKNSEIVIDSQKEVNITMTSIEAMAAGCVVLAHKRGGTYTEVLENGKYGFGFKSIEEGAKKLKEIIDKLKAKGINNKESVKRAENFSLEKFEERLKKIINV